MNKQLKTLVGILIFIALWQGFVFMDIFNPIYFASPFEVYTEGMNMFQHQSVYLDTYYTLWRVLMSVVLAIVIGTPIGVILGYFSKAYQTLSGVIDFIRSIPPVVIYPLLLIGLGIGDESRIATALFGSIVVLVLIIAEGISNQDNTRRQFFYSRGARHRDIIKEIIWYEALPHTFVAIRTITSLSVIIIIVTEMLVSTKYGLGTRVQNVQITSNIPDLFVTIIIIGLMGIALNKITVSLEKYIVFWKEE
ncbi:hypothetical protein COB57_01840 [Candidatus Peregrinibacteria bacterium]|nr:MAG: hypothetical protein COB57_01840 [Candidatus Peregrinibacteria bacterium]